MSTNQSLSLTKQAYNILKTRIMQLRLRPGELLMVQSLAKEMGISRTPVREALIRLERDGFVTEADGKKFRVSELNLTDIIEISEIRELIELHAISKVASTCSDTQLDELITLVREMGTAFSENDHVSFFQKDMAFHARIVHFGNNATLEKMMIQLNEKIQRIRHLTPFVYQLLEDPVGEHEDILSSIKQRDPERARQTLRYHLDRVKNGVIKLFQDDSVNFFGGFNIKD
jgi:DNA-binding GntR family transcriptional regulator